MDHVLIKLNPNRWQNPLPPTKTLEKPTHHPRHSLGQAWRMAKSREKFSSSPKSWTLLYCYAPFSIIWHLKLLDSTAIKNLMPTHWWIILLCESQNECYNLSPSVSNSEIGRGWYQAEDDMRPRTIAFFIKQLSWQVLALAGQETSNHIVQSLIELLPQVPGLNLYKESWLSNPSFRKKKKKLADSLPWNILGWSQTRSGQSANF